MAAALLTHEPGGRSGPPSFAVDGRELVATDARGRTHRYRLGRAAGEAAAMALMKNYTPTGRNRAVVAIVDGTGRWLAVAPLWGFSTVEAQKFAAAAGLEFQEVEEQSDAEVVRTIARDKPTDLAPAGAFEIVAGLILVTAFVVGIVLAVTGLVHPAIALIGVPLLGAAAVVVIAVIRRRTSA
jgi:hypothetical protein